MKPATMKPARYMCVSSCQRFLLKSAVRGSTSVTSPFRIEKPVGWFIQPFTAITMKEPVNPARITGKPAAKCTLGDRRSHPYT